MASNAGTMIHCHLVGEHPAELRVFDLVGQSVATLPIVPSTSGARTVTWSGADDEGHPLASGVYLVQLVQGRYTQASKLLLVR